MAHGYCVLVVWTDGTEEFLKQGLGDKPAIFHSRKEAKEQADFVKMGMDDDECESVSVVSASMAV